jgi:integrase
MLKGWEPKDPISVAEVHNRPGTFRGVVDTNGLLWPFNQLTAHERRRLTTPRGEPALLFLSARDGAPLSRDSVEEVTGDVSKVAEANADTRGSWFPHVHTHDLRHTYATHLAAVFMLGVATTPGRDLHGRPPRVDVQSAVKMAGVGLGHLDEATTALYIQQVGLMLARYPLGEFLGRA